MDKSREHESKVLQLLTQSNLVSDTCQQPPFEVMHHFGSAQYADCVPVTADYNQQWYHLLIRGIRKGYLFCQKWYIKVYFRSIFSPLSGSIRSL